LTNGIEISKSHPRAESLRIREELVEDFEAKIVAEAGLIAHGRGEAFDYLLGEKTQSHALRSTRAAAALMLLAKHPVISVNGNAASLSAKDLIELSNLTGAKLEVNLFYRTRHRERAVAEHLRSLGAANVLGNDQTFQTEFQEVHSSRRRVDVRGIVAADVVLVPLEDGDRVDALAKAGKKTIVIDLNPLSRSSRSAIITVVDNIVRAAPNLVDITRLLKGENRSALEQIVSEFDNKRNLSEAVESMISNLRDVAAKLEEGYTQRKVGD